MRWYNREAIFSFFKKKKKKIEKMVFQYFFSQNTNYPAWSHVSL